MRKKTKKPKGRTPGASCSDKPTPTPGPSNEAMDTNTEDAGAIRYTQERPDREFENSEEDENKEPASQIRKEYRPPPIALREEGKLELIRKESAANNIQLRSCKSTREGIKLFPETAADFRRGKKLKVVLRGIPKEIPVEEVENELIQRGFPVSSATRMKRFKEDLPLILINTEKSSDGKRLFDMTDATAMKISTEPKRKSTAATQCFRCQKYGHIQFRGTAAFRCLRCVEEHATYECPHKGSPPENEMHELWRKPPRGQ
ncbi:hypothetical protein Trydic_g638 [Trypoxylus dichotomus]